MKRKYVRALLDDVVRNLDAIDVAAKDGWHRDDLIRSDLDLSQVYHKVVGKLLVSMATHERDDVKMLNVCWAAIDQSLDISVDLDLFDAVGPLHTSTLKWPSHLTPGRERSI